MASFESYIDAARGRPGGWRILVGLLIIGVFWVAGTVLVMGLWVGAQMAQGMDMQAALGTLNALAEGGGSPPIMAVMLLTFSGVWIGVLIVQKALHGVRFRSIFAPDLRVHWRDFAKGILLSLAFTIPGALVALMISDPVRTEMDLGYWLVWLVPLTALIFVQATAEELIFRGYLLQQLASISRSPVLWAGVPSVLFGLMHFSPGLPEGGGYYYVLVTLLTGLTLALLVWRAGNLWTAAGLHLATNTVGLTVIGAEGVLTGSQLWLLPESDMAALFRIDLVTSALMLALVASPLGRIFGDGGRLEAPEVRAFE